MLQKDRYVMLQRDRYVMLQRDRYVMLQKLHFCIWHLNVTHLILKCKQRKQSQQQSVALLGFIDFTKIKYEICLAGGIQGNPPLWGEWEFLLVEVFYRVVGIWWEMILTIQTFFRCYKQHSVNIEHPLKSKLAWNLCTRDTKLKNNTVAMTAAKNEVWSGWLHGNCYLEGG